MGLAFSVRGAPIAPTKIMSMWATRATVNSAARPITDLAVLIAKIEIIDTATAISAGGVDRH